MLRRQILLLSFGALPFLLLGFPAAASAADGDKVEKIAGLVFDKTKDSITIKGDGEDAPVKYVIKDADKQMKDNLKGIFGANRATLTYKKDGETRVLVSIKRQVLKEKGTITGTVVGVHNKFWIEVKPKDGVSDGFAPGGDNWNSPDFKAWRDSLKPGDSVTLSYTTDGERHCIVGKNYKTNTDK